MSVATLGKAVIAQWNDLDRWVIPNTAFLSQSAPRGWSMERIGDITTLVSDTVAVEPESEYKMAGVRWYGEGVFHRETVTGNNLSARNVSPLIADALIYNRLFAWKESFAIVPENLTDCHVSNEFPQFVVNPDKALPEYLYLWCLATPTMQAVTAASTGSAAVSRNRFREEYFRDFRIALPPLPVQQKIVSYWKDAQSKATAMMKQADLFEQEQEFGFLAALGVARPSNEIRAKMLTMRWQEMERWDLAFARRAHFNPKSNKFKNFRIRDVILPVDSTTRRILPTDMPEYLFHYVGMENVEANTGALVGELKKIGREIKSSSIAFDNEHVLYGKLRPYLRKVVDCSELSFPDGIASSEFLPLKPNTRVIQAWLAIYLRSIAIAEQAKVAIGARMPRVATPAFLDFIVPVPPKPEQEKMLLQFEDYRTKIAKLRVDAEILDKTAKSDVEAMILGRKPVV